MSEIIFRIEVHEGALVAFETKRGIVATTFGADSLPANLRKMALMIERYDDFSAKNAAHPVAKPIPDERTAEMEQLMGIIKEYRTAPRLHTIGWLMCISDEFGDTRCPTCIKADELFDHIEGKAKADGQR